MRERERERENKDALHLYHPGWISKGLGSHSPECRQAWTWEALSLNPTVGTKEEIPHLTSPGEMVLLNRGCQGWL